MQKILGRWYLGFLILPVVTNYLTEILKLPHLFNNWLYTIVGVLVISNLILIYELIKLSNKYKVLKVKPKARDKQIVKELLGVLDIADFHENIVAKDSWTGYRYDSIQKTILFPYYAENIKNQTGDKVLNQLIIDFAVSLEDFNEFSSLNLCSDNATILLPLSKEKRAQENCDIMNQKATIAFEKLEILMDYIRPRGYLD
jgi:hypothetical protein